MVYRAMKSSTNLTTQFLLAGLQRLRRAAVRAARFPDLGQDGWRKSPVDPRRLLDVFPALHLRNGYVLRAYSFREGGNGNALVYAAPLASPFPEPGECPRDDRYFLGPPMPPDALSNAMDAIEGDGSPLSYLSASLFARELDEFGAMWHGCSWSTHVILGKNPFAGRPASTEFEQERELWEWLEPEPDDWRPTVVLGDTVTVRFFSFSALGQQRLIRHLDRFRPNSYRFDCDENEIAKGPAGFVF
jgi:hypothetical protein